MKKEEIAQFNMLRKLLIEKISSLSGEFKKNEILEKLKELVYEKLEDLAQVYQKDKNILEKIFHIKVKEIINPDIAEKSNNIFIQKEDQVFDFIYRGTIPQKQNRDFYALCCGFYGFIDYQEKFNKGLVTSVLNKVERVKKQEKDNPFIENALKQFFDQDCYVYAYDEDLTKLREENRKKYHYPNIDALVLTYDGKYFTLKNIEDKENHYFGEFTWCGQSYDESTNNNAFDIVFKESPTKLILRIHYPNKNYKHGNSLDLMLGAFLVTRKKGNLSMGNVVLLKDKAKKDKKPFKYRFKDIGFKQQQEINETIKWYLFDKYRNWINVPYDKSTIKDLEVWLKKKKRKNYTDKRVTQYDYLITCPSTSYKEKDERNRITQNILDLLEKSEEKLKGDKFLKDSYREAFSKDIEKKMKEKKILLYPDPETPREKADYINYKFFENLNQSMNVIIVIPKRDYKKISSIYTVIGYCIALGKNTFVFYQKGIKMPNLLTHTEEEVNLYVRKYEQLNHIPRLLLKDDNSIIEGWKTRYNIQES